MKLPSTKAMLAQQLSFEPLQLLQGVPSQALAGLLWPAACRSDFSDRCRGVQKPNNRCNRD